MMVQDKILSISNILMYQMLNSIQQNEQAFADKIIEMSVEAKVSKNQNDSIGKLLDIEV